MSQCRKHWKEQGDFLVSPYPALAIHPQYDLITDQSIVVLDIKKQEEKSLGKKESTNYWP